MTDLFLSAFEQFVDGKIELMKEMTTALAAASNPSAICGKLRALAGAFHRFRETIEIPFEAPVCGSPEVHLAGENRSCRGIDPVRRVSSCFNS